jgi:hypothetical protein
MGRYYSGDIEGKFWFGIQDSDDASFFGVEPCEPSHIEYCFAEEDKKGVEEGIAECRKSLGDYKAKLDDFFRHNNGYQDKVLAKHLDVGQNKLRTLLEWYARLELGEKIKKSLDGKGECCFKAELY